MPDYFTKDQDIIKLVSRIRELLSGPECGASLLDLGKSINDDIALIDRTKLLVLLIANDFGCTVTRNHLYDSPFFPIFHRKEGKGVNYIGNALSNNRPGFHTDGSAWREARIDPLGLLCVQTIVTLA